MAYSVYELLGLFMVYSFLGWCVEVVFSAVVKGQVVNRGFLNGPLCPIYGVGMIVVLVLLEPISSSAGVLFLGGLVLCSLLELIGGWILERVFDTRWWDYSDRPFNLGGYVCLSFSILWGMAVTFVVRLIHPAILSLVDHVPPTLRLVLVPVVYALFLADLTVTLITIAGIKRQMRELRAVAEALHTVGDAISGRLGTTAMAADARLDGIKETGQVKVSEGKEKVTAAIQTGQEKAKESREKVTAAIQSGQEKARESLEELQEKRRELEDRQRRLMERYRNRFGVRRLTSAFPGIRRAIQEHLDNMDKE